MTPDEWGWYAEAEKRGVLTPDEQEWYTEAKGRGLAPGVDPVLSEGFLEENPAQQEKMVDTIAYMQVMGADVDPVQVYEMHDQLKTQFDEQGVSFGSEMKEVIGANLRVATSLVGSMGMSVIAGYEALFNAVTPEGALTVDVMKPGTDIKTATRLVMPDDPDYMDYIEEGYEPGAGLRGAAETIGERLQPYTDLLKTEEEEKALELIAKPIEYSGEGWRLIGEGIESGLAELGLDVKYIEPVLATLGEGAGLVAMGKAVPVLKARVKGSTWFRQLTVPEKGLVVQSLAETIKKNPKMTEGEILKQWDNPEWRAEALKARELTKEPTAEPVKPVVKPVEEVKAAEVPEDVTVFRGGGEPLDVARGGDKGISVTRNKATAELFTDPAKEVVSEALLPASAKILQDADIPSELLSDYLTSAKKLESLSLSESKGVFESIQKDVIEKQAEIIKYARENGFDGVEFKFEDEIRIIKPNVLKAPAEAVKAVEISELNKAATTKPVQRIKPPQGFEEIYTYEGEGYRVTQVKEGKLEIQNKFQIEIEPDRKLALEGIIKDVEAGEAGGRSFIEKGEGEGGGRDVVGFSSTYPEFMRDQGWTGKEVIKAINKAVEGKDLGSRQSQIVEAAIEHVNEMAQADPLYEGFPKYEFKTEPKRRVPPKKDLIKMLQDDRLIPELARLRFIEALRRVKDKSGIRNIVTGIEKAWKLEAERKYVKAIETSKQLQKVDNLRKFMDFPAVTKMNLKQLKDFEKVLGELETGDVLLTQRQMETIGQTDIAGIKTIREAKVKFAERAGIPQDEVGVIKVDAFDRMRYDTVLAKQNPFYKVLVEDYHNTTLSADMRFLEFEKVSNEMAKAARSSRKQGKLDKLIPSDKLVFEYLSASDKAAIAKKMTPEELDYATMLEAKFAEALQYLIETKSLETGRENYITNIRRDAFETIKEDGIKQAVKEILNQQKLDEQTFNILDQMTGDILPLNKFFQFSMRRTGDITPTKNVAKAATTYFKTFEKKKALDSFMPKMMVFVDALTPPKTTETGLIMDQRLKTFVKEWINTKKGRPSKLVLTPGSKTDLSVKALKGFVSMWDLGGNVPVGMAATVGETAATYVALGKKGMAKGVKRLNTKQGKIIVEKYKNFVGKSVWEELAEPSKSLSDKMTGALFGFFQQSALRSNKLYLLASLTEAEFKSGKVGAARLAEIRVSMGEYRVVPGMKSIAGSTTEIGLLSHYKTWAVPILTSKARNMGIMAKDFFDKSKKGTLKGKEFNEFKNAIEVTTAALIVISLMPADEEGFIGQIKGKVKREALTILGALDPTFWTSEPRMLQWVGQVATIVKELVLLEEYSDTAPYDVRGDLKGVEHAKDLITPRALKQLQSEPTTGLEN